MVITVDRERGTIRALRETQKGGQLPLMTIYDMQYVPYNKNTCDIEGSGEEYEDAMPVRICSAPFLYVRAVCQFV